MLKIFVCIAFWLLLFEKVIYCEENDSNDYADVEILNNNLGNETLPKINSPHSSHHHDHHHHDHHHHHHHHYSKPTRFNHPSRPSAAKTTPHTTYRLTKPSRTKTTRTTSTSTSTETETETTPTTESTSTELKTTTRKTKPSKTTPRRTKSTKGSTTVKITLPVTKPTPKPSRTKHWTTTHKTTKATKPTTKPSKTKHWTTTHKTTKPTTKTSKPKTTKKHRTTRKPSTTKIHRTWPSKTKRTTKRTTTTTKLETTTTECPETTTTECETETTTTECPETTTNECPEITTTECPETTRECPETTTTECETETTTTECPETTTTECPETTTPCPDECQDDCEDESQNGCSSPILIPICDPTSPKFDIFTCLSVMGKMYPVICDLTDRSFSVGLCFGLETEVLPLVCLRHSQAFNIVSCLQYIATSQINPNCTAVTTTSSAGQCKLLSVPDVCNPFKGSFNINSCLGLSLSILIPECNPRASSFDPIFCITGEKLIQIPLMCSSVSPDFDLISCISALVDIPVCNGEINTILPVNSSTSIPCFTLSLSSSCNPSSPDYNLFRCLGTNLNPQCDPQSNAFNIIRCFTGINNILLPETCFSWSSSFNIASCLDFVINNPLCSSPPEPIIDFPCENPDQCIPSNLPSSCYDRNLLLCPKELLFDQKGLINPRCNPFNPLFNIGICLNLNFITQTSECVSTSVNFNINSCLTFVLNSPICPSTTTESQCAVATLLTECDPSSTEFDILICLFLSPGRSTISCLPSSDNFNIPVCLGVNLPIIPSICIPSADDFNVVACLEFITTSPIGPGCTSIALPSTTTTESHCVLPTLLTECDPNSTEFDIIICLFLSPGRSAISCLPSSDTFNIAVCLGVNLDFIPAVCSPSADNFNVTACLEYITTTPSGPGCSTILPTISTTEIQCVVPTLLTECDPNSTEFDIIICLFLSPGRSPISCLPTSDSFNIAVCLGIDLNPIPSVCKPSADNFNVTACLEYITTIPPGPGCSSKEVTTPSTISTTESQCIIPVLLTECDPSSTEFDVLVCLLLTPGRSPISCLPTSANFNIAICLGIDLNPIPSVCKPSADDFSAVACLEYISTAPSRPGCSPSSISTSMSSTSSVTPTPAQNQCIIPTLLTECDPASTDFDVIICLLLTPGRSPISCLPTSASFNVAICLGIDLNPIPLVCKPSADEFNIVACLEYITTTPNGIDCSSSTSIAPTTSTNAQCILPTLLTECDPNSTEFDIIICLFLSPGRSPISCLPTSDSFNIAVCLGIDLNPIPSVCKPSADNFNVTACLEYITTNPTGPGCLSTEVTTPSTISTTESQCILPILLTECDPNSDEFDIIICLFLSPGRSSISCLPSSASFNIAICLGINLNPIPLVCRPSADEFNVVDCLEFITTNPTGPGCSTAPPLPTTQIQCSLATLPAECNPSSSTFDVLACLFAPGRSPAFCLPTSDTFNIALCLGLDLSFYPFICIPSAKHNFDTIGCLKQILLTPIGPGCSTYSPSPTISTSTPIPPSPGVCLSPNVILDVRCIPDSDAFNSRECLTILIAQKGQECSLSSPRFNIGVCFEIQSNLLPSFCNITAFNFNLVSCLDFVSKLPYCGPTTSSLITASIPQSTNSPTSIIPCLPSLLPLECNPSSNIFNPLNCLNSAPAGGSPVCTISTSNFNIELCLGISIGAVPFTCSINSLGFNLLSCLTAIVSTPLCSSLSTTTQTPPKIDYCRPPNFNLVLCLTSGQG